MAITRTPPPSPKSQNQGGNPQQSAQEMDLETLQATNILQRNYGASTGNVTEDTEYLMTATSYNSQAVVDEPRGKKRDKPESDLSPQSVQQRYQPSFISNENCKISDENADIHVFPPPNQGFQHNRNFQYQSDNIEKPGPSNCPGTFNSGKNVTPNNKEKWSFTVKSEKPIILNKLLEAISSNMPTGSFIIRQKLAKNRKFALFKTTDLNKKTNNCLNYFLQETIIERVRLQYQDPSIEIKHFDVTQSENLKPSNKQENHVIAKNVSTEYSEEWIKSMIEHSNPDIDLLSCHRISSRERGEKTSMIRVIFKSKSTAETAIKEGLKISAMLVKCEKPIPRIEPQQCYKCQNFNHTTKECPNEQACGKCTSKDHRSKDCTKTRPEYKCALCNGQHAAWYNGCTVKIQEIRAMAQKENEKQKQLPTAQPATKKEMNQMQKAQLRTQETVTQKIEHIGESCNEQIEKLRKEMHERYDSMESKIDTYMKSLRNLINEQTGLLKNGSELSPTTKPTSGGKSALTTNHLKDQLKKSKEEITCEMNLVINKANEELRCDLKNQTELQLKKVNKVVDDRMNDIHNMVQKSYDTLENRLNLQTEQSSDLKDKMVYLDNELKLVSNNLDKNCQQLSNAIENVNKPKPRQARATSKNRKMPNGTEVISNQQATTNPIYGPVGTLLHPSQFTHLVDQVMLVEPDQNFILSQSNSNTLPPQ